MVENQAQNPPAEKVIALSASLLEPFQGHPFRVVRGEEMEQLKESIRAYGVLSPLLVRPCGDGRYEIVSGHRRKAACEALGITELPVLVRNMTDDEAVILMVDSNIQREHILPSEKAFAYKMKMEAVKHQGKTMAEATCGQLGHKSRDSLSQTESGRTVQRYIRLWAAFFMSGYSPEKWRLYAVLFFCHRHFADPCCGPRRWPWCVGRGEFAGRLWQRQPRRECSCTVKYHKKIMSN